MILFDTNILVHAHMAGSPFHAIARRLRDEAAEGRLEACLTPQVLCEFFAVCTDPRMVHPALTPRQANEEIGRYWNDSAFRKILPQDTTVPRLVGLLARKAVARQAVFDAFLVATMLDHGVRTIYTQNTKDFVRFQELRVVNPLATPAVS